MTNATASRAVPSRRRLTSALGLHDTAVPCHRRWRPLALACSLGLSLQAGNLPAQVVLNEIMADNQSAVANGEDYPDWVELFNPSAAAVNVAGMSLTDDVVDKAKFVFPPATTVPANGRLIVWCDSATNSPGLHTGFGFKSEGELVALYDTPARGSVLRDRLAFGLQIADRTIGRVPDGGNWTLTTPTPLRPNEAVALGLPSALRFNEWLATNSASADKDWFELHNSAKLPVALGGLVFTDQLTTPDNRAAPDLSFVDGGGFLQFIADNLEASEAADHADFRLSSSTGETLTLYAADRKTVLNRVTFGPQARDVSEGRLPDGGARIVPFPIGKSTPAASNFLPLTGVVINEVLTHTDWPVEDAIELYNPTTAPIAIGQWFLSNSQDDPAKYRIPKGTVIAPGGFKVFYEYQFNPDYTGNAPSFTLNSAHGDEVLLFSTDAAGNLDGYRAKASFSAAANRVSFGRYQTSVGVDFVALNAHTFGADAVASLTDFQTGAGKANAPPLVGPVVINEIMYHPPDFVSGGILLDNSLDEFIELLNVKTEPTPLFDPLAETNTWKLANGIEFTFPQDITLPAGGFLLVVNFDPTTNLTQLAAFQLKYGVEKTVPIVGPYAGKLANSGEAMELLQPDPPQGAGHPDAGFVPYVLVEKVKYSNLAPWPGAADGLGSALLRKTAGDYANDPVNWVAGAPTAGRANFETPAREIRLTRINLADASTVRFAWTSEINRTYRVQFKENLLASSWTDLREIVAAGTEATASDSVSLNGHRYYRVELVR